MKPLPLWAKATTTADGSFAIECERAEPMSLCVLARGDAFPAVELEEVTPGGAAITVTVPATASAYVRGALVTSDGAPAKGADVVLSRGRRSHSTGFQLEPTTGAFSMGPFPSGEYFAFVAARDAPVVSIGTLRLDAGTTLDVGRIVVGEAGSLTARVTGENGEPLRSGWLNVLTPAGWHMGGGPIKAGAAHLARITPGEYLIHVQGNTSEERALQRAVVRANLDTVVDLRPNLVATHTVTVREVLRPHRDPIRQVEIDVFDAAGVLVDRAANGRQDNEAWLVRVVLPPDGRGTLVVKGDNVERTRLSIPTDGPIEVTLR